MRGFHPNATHPNRARYTVRLSCGHRAVVTQWTAFMVHEDRTAHAPCETCGRLREAQLVVSTQR